MQFSTAQSTIVSVSAVLAVAASGIVGYAAVATGDGESGGGRDVPAMNAPNYVGDPWEKRFRDRFWASQHIHDSWNKCHIGENVPRRLQRGDDCWSRLTSQTAR